MAYLDANEAWPVSGQEAVSEDFLAGGGDVADAIRAFDWRAAGIGPIEDWPISLKTTVRLVLNSRQPMCFWWGPDLVKFYNDAYVPMLGQRLANALGRPFREVWADVWDDVLPYVRSALSGEPTWAEDLPLVMHRNGYPEQTYWTFSYSPIFGDDGRVHGLLNIVTETTQAVADRRAIEEAYGAVREHLREKENLEGQLRLLNRELVHRLKNTLAMTQSIVSQSLRGVASPADALVSVSARIGALAKAQDMLTSVSGRPAGLEEVVLAALAPLSDRTDRFRVDGPAALLTAQQALGLSLAIHELGTNAIKYGALSTPEGRIEIGWSLDLDGSFSLAWEEAGGPPVVAPTRRGFGSRLTERVVADIFHGVARMAFEPEGLSFRIDGRLERLTDAGRLNG